MHIRAFRQSGLGQAEKKSERKTIMCMLSGADVSSACCDLQF